jgi:8-oxo-dGTP diphosphatase
LPAGHIDGGETLTTALIRELKEEIDVEVLPKDMVPVLFVHRFSPETEYIDAFFKINSWEGTPRIAEEDKCDAIEWFPKDKLPSNLIAYVGVALEAIDRGEVYLETGWK